MAFLTSSIFEGILSSGFNRVIQVRLLSQICQVTSSTIFLSYSLLANQAILLISEIKALIVVVVQPKSIRRNIGISGDLRTLGRLDIFGAAETVWLSESEIFL